MRRALVFLCSFILIALCSCTTSKVDASSEVMTVFNRSLEKCQVEINPLIEKNVFDTCWLKKRGEFYYTKKGAPYKVVNGVDVSRHQGKVDFKYLKKKGYEFVILRLAYRRYGYESGNLVKDENFDVYYRDAKDAGLKIGVYVYSQAINEEEALEEAQIVLDNLKPEDLELPVVYDPEFVFWDEARTDNVPEFQFNLNTEVFMSAVQQAGFSVMLYSNIMWQVFVFTPEILNKYDIWFAQYSKKPTTPYKFTFWQYSGDSKIRGSENPCDMNVWFIPVESPSE